MRGEERTHKITDLTKGKPFALILGFSVPFIIGDFFQQLYNTVDSVIVGRFVGKSALAALGVAGPIMSIVMFFLTGLAIGGGVVMSQYFGGGKVRETRAVMSTALIVGGAFTLVLTAVSIGLSRPFLRLLGTPTDILGAADSYLKIVFAGSIFTFVYNMYCYGIRAIGNSVVPLVILLVSVALNGVLDVLFVITFKWGVAGAAWATVAAQAVSAATSVIYTQTRVKLLAFKPAQFKVDKKQISKIAKYGSALALQQVFVYIGRIAVQGIVNSYGTDVIAGVNAATRLDALVQTPARGYTNALTTYCAQNYGAGDAPRIRAGYASSWISIAVYGVAATAIGIFAARPLVSLFVDVGETTVIDVGAKFMATMASGYVLMCIIVQSQALLKGIGMLKSFFFSTFTAISLRIGLSYLFNYLWGLDGMYWAVPASWVGGSAAGLIMVAIAFARKLKRMPLTSEPIVENFRE